MGAYLLKELVKQEPGSFDMVCHGCLGSIRVMPNDGIVHRLV